MLEEIEMLPREFPEIMSFARGSVLGTRSAPRSAPISRWSLVGVWSVSRRWLITLQGGVRPGPKAKISSASMAVLLRKGYPT
jgi:hypothetical protein